MSALERPHITPEKYLEGERTAEFKSEYFDGDMLMMAGNTKEHVVIVGNIWAELRTALRTSDCQPFGTELRVKVDEHAYAYPDVAVACGEQQYLDDRLDTLLNPTVIFEVLSPSTEAYDRGHKFARYQGLRSLRQYVMVSQGSVRVESYLRNENNDWLLHVCDKLTDVLELSPLDCTLNLSEIYHRLPFAQA